MIPQSHINNFPTEENPFFPNNNTNAHPPTLAGIAPPSAVNRSDQAYNLQPSSMPSFDQLPDSQYPSIPAPTPIVMSQANQYTPTIFLTRTRTLVSIRAFHRSIMTMERLVGGPSYQTRLTR